MSEISAAAGLANPPGLQAHNVYPGWTGQDHGTIRQTMQTAAGPLPKYFTADYLIEDVQGTLILEWEIEEFDRVRLVRASMSNEGDPDPDDLMLALARLRKLWSAEDEWRQATVRWLITAVQSTTTMQRYSREGRSVGPGDAYVQNDDEAASLRLALSAARELSTAPRRDRITADLLREVAFVYRQAHAQGRRPTQAVADHFGKPRSTAGRWVSSARSVGYLGPANGPRAGEAPAAEDDDG